MTVLVTGGTGFVGSGLLPRLEREGVAVRLMARDPGRAPCAVESVMCDISTETPPAVAWAGVDAVVHLAARVHVMQETASDPLTEFRAVNRDATLRLARIAREQGVRRFVFLSSIKVNGESTDWQPFRSDDPPEPVDPYGISKWEAELGLQELAARTGLEVVVIRAPLVHGPGAGGNLRRLLGWISKGIPLPFGAVQNRRRLVGRENLADLIVRALQHPAATRGVLLAGDAETVSTPALIRLMAEGLGRAPRLIPVPPALLALGGRLIGRAAEVSRLIGSLDVDVAQTMIQLDWRPPVSLAAGIHSMAGAFKAGS